MTLNLGRRGLARGVALAAVLPLASGLLIAAAPSAGAAVNQPVDGAVYDQGYPDVAISADFGRSTSGGTERLFLSSPGGPEVEVAAKSGSVNGGRLDYTLRLECWTKGCSGTRLAPNGTWTVRQDGSTTDTSTFVTRNRPRTPQSVTATPLNPSEMRVSWRLGDEPDLTGWAVLEGSDVVKDADTGACNGTSCSVVIGYPTEGSGEHTYTVRAFRSTAPGSGSVLESALSAPASGRLESPPPPPPPSPEPSPEGGGTDGGSGSGSGEPGTEPGGGTGGGTVDGGGAAGGPTSGPDGGGSAGGGTGSGGGTGTGGAGNGGGSNSEPIRTGTSDAGQTADERAVSQRKAFALSFSAFGPKLGIPKLPPLPQAPSPAIAPELADGTYEPTLGFGDQVLTERVPVAQGPTARVRNVVGSALDSERLIRSTAAALVLLLAGAHLRRWLGSATEEH